MVALPIMTMTNIGGMMMMMNDLKNMKHLKLFEDFKQKNISLDDIITCINRGGVVYATIINGYPDNDPELPMNPLSVDEFGTVTVNISGQNHEIELENIDKIEWM